VGVTSYIDINVFIYWLGSHPSFGEVAYNWIKKVEKASRGEYVTSSLTIYETLVIIAGLTGRNLKDMFFIESVIRPIINLKGLVITPLKPEDYLQGANLMKEYHLDYEDSLHLATAIRMNAKKIISNDKDFDKTPLKRTF
jgi:predicted nucleic acid-binding protein